MPRGDCTGPRGMGPMTGRAAGYCAGYPLPGCANSLPGFGMGLGLGCGRGRGRMGGGLFRRHRFAKPLYPPDGPGFPEGTSEVGVADEQAYLLQAQKSLEAHLEYLGGQLKQVKECLQELEEKDRE
ncbi:MAG TPA: DUF5320 domain-containing protein [Firmicutes bacterium]|nr:DUF5320 domain-containing protein [Bacillota bacterium]